MQDIRTSLIVFLFFIFVLGVSIDRAEGAYPPTPDRVEGEGSGPHNKLVIRGAMLIDGTGAPPRGPLDIVIEGNRIADIVSVDTEEAAPEELTPSRDADFEIDARGAYVMPGIVDTHVHIRSFGDEYEAYPEYAYKLLLAHGVTTIRGVALGPLDWSLNERNRSSANKIVAPRISLYATPGLGVGKQHYGFYAISSPTTVEEATSWLNFAVSKGIDGIKFFETETPEITQLLLNETKKNNLGSIIHMKRLNYAEASKMGFDTLTHLNFGFVPALSEDATDPDDMDVADNQEKFRLMGRQWRLAPSQGSPQWNKLLDELLTNDTYLNPTFSIAEANRDLMRVRNADWHDKFTLPVIWRSFQADNNEKFAAWHYDWTTKDEVDWQNLFRIGFAFANEYKDRGGKVTVGSDASILYQSHGFGTIREMEMLEAAGFSPLEVIRAATMHGAMELAKPTGKSIEYGVIRPGMLADMLIVAENPLDNFKVLYGTGHTRFNDKTKQVEQVGGVKYTIKDGIVYDAKKLLQDVVDMVEAAKAAK